MGYVLRLVVDHQAVDTVITNQQVRAVANNQVRNPLSPGEEHHRYKLVHAADRDEHRRGAPYPKGVMLAHRLVADDFEAGCLLQSCNYVGTEGDRGTPGWVVGRRRHHIYRD